MDRKTAAKLSAIKSLIAIIILAHSQTTYSKGKIFNTSSFCRENLFEGLHGSSWYATCSTVILPYILTDIIYLPSDILPAIYDLHIEAIERGDPAAASSTEGSSTKENNASMIQERKFKISLYQSLQQDAVAVKAGLNVDNPIFLALATALQKSNSNRTLEEIELFLADKIIELGHRYNQALLEGETQ